jgi:hemoglobin
VAEYAPTPSDLPFTRLGGEAAVRAIVERFYDGMERLEPELATLHERDAAGRVSRAARDRFALFLIGWLGGPQDYVARHGHPRLRMRHAHVRVDVAMRDAWLRCMSAALECGVVVHAWKSAEGDSAAGMRQRRGGDSHHG